MFKTLACTALSTVCLLFVPLAWAAVERETFEVFVTIPTADFYVLPVDPQLVQREQRLGYNPVSSELSPLRAQFEVKNVGGAIGARLEAQPYLFNGKDRIDLRVTFNQQELSLERSEVVSTVDARPGRRVPLEIVAIKPPEDYQPGHYYGTVSMVFDAIAPHF
ncbi:CS1 type fimbrial major subunit [Pseudomonas poae]|uniref:CS1 type fimbrial major subunit n=1 Tax=Pseudomonas poae TaxID=200451 RepID=A0ABY0RFM6_9PSED|nr:CS1 type fimbrial major subunit [Pseudomonas poae]KRP52286.1 adhesin major subunit pilin [Pseudomonas poae]SDN98048.1 CS1 type fimbrial major subunit [Pseudomonas poae]